MTVRLVYVTLLVLALGLGGCGYRHHSSATPARQEHAEPPSYSPPTPDTRVRPTDDIIPAAGQPLPAGPVLARDLGSGAGGEKLGGFARRVHPSARRPVPSPFIDIDQPDGDASTFALSVHTGSASLVRQALLDRGRWPERDQVRAEELVNAFTYADPRPTRADPRPFRITAETVACPWERSHQIVRVAVTSRPLSETQRPPANLVFLLDVSGSMAADGKLPLLKRSLHLLVERLGAEDRVAIVTYAGSATVALQPTPGDHTREILNAIDRLRASGGTNGSDGLRQAYSLARQEFRRDGATRVILASDGDFNAGITNDAELERLIDDQTRAGIYLTVLGLGMGTRQDRRFERLADRGNGFYAYIDSDDEAKRLFAEQLPASLTTLAEDAKIQVFFNPVAVRAWRLLGYEQRTLDRRAFNDDRVGAGEIGAGHAVTALYEVVPAWSSGDSDPNPFVDRREPEPQGFSEGPALRVRLRWQPPGGGASELMEQDVAASHRPAAATADAAWCLAVTGFAYLLRNEGWYGAIHPTWREVIDLAETGMDGPDRAARREFLLAMEKARALAARR